METLLLDKYMKSDVCVLVGYSQVGEWWQVFEGSLWYQWYVVTMERPGRAWKSGRKGKKEHRKESVCVTFSKLSTTSHVLGLILTTNEETWVHRMPSLVCTADGCNSEFFTHRVNQLAWRQMQTYFSRYLQMQQGVFQGNILFLTTFHRAKQLSKHRHIHS